MFKIIRYYTCKVKIGFRIPLFVLLDVLFVLVYLHSIYQDDTALLIRLKEMQIERIRVFINLGIIISYIRFQINSFVVRRKRKNNFSQKKQILSKTSEKKMEKNSAPWPFVSYDISKKTCKD